MQQLLVKCWPCLSICYDLYLIVCLNVFISIQVDIHSKFHRKKSLFYIFKV